MHRTEQWASGAGGWVHPGKFQREEEKIWEAHCIRPYPGCASRTLCSLERANEGSKKQKSIVKAGSGSMGHSQNQWSRGGSPGEEPGSSKLPLVTASMNSWELRTTFKCPWLMRPRPGLDKLRKDYRGPWPSHTEPVWAFYCDSYLSLPLCNCVKEDKWLLTNFKLQSLSSFSVSSNHFYECSDDVHSSDKS